MSKERIPRKSRSKSSHHHHHHHADKKKGKFKMFFRKFGLVVWKNLLLRKRQWLVTSLEILFPTVILLLLVVLTAKIRPTLPFGKEQSPKDHDISNESHLKNIKICRSSIANTPEDTPFIAFTPNNSETTKVMEQVAVEICKDSIGKPPSIIAVDSESDLETQYSQKWRTNGHFHGAVVFPDKLEKLQEAISNRKGVIAYKIRMSPELFPSTRVVLPTRDQKPYWSSPEEDSGFVTDFSRVGPNSQNEKRYVKSGFLGLQLSLDKVLSKTITSKDFTKAVSLQPFPYPPYKKPITDIGRSYMIDITYFTFSWGLCFMIPSITRNVVGEKQSGISELLRLTDVSTFIQWMGWLIHAVWPQLITVSAITFILCSSTFNNGISHGDPTLVWVILLLYVIATAAFLFFLCSLFQKPTIATTVAELLWIISLLGGLSYFMLKGLIPFDYRIGLSVFPNFALALILVNVMELEWQVVEESDAPSGAQWSNLDTKVKISSPIRRQIFEESQDVSNLQIILMLCVDIVVYMTLAVYLECVLPSEHGVRRPWYLFNFNCSRGKRQGQVANAGVPPPPPPTTQSTTSGVDGAEPKNDDTVQPSESQTQQQHGNHSKRKKSEAVTSSPSIQAPIVSSFEPEPAGAVVGVDIQGLQKRFGFKKVAVNGVSLRMFSGDIFALLGHNGAGKTTLISMLTGFFAPSGGTALINGHDIRHDMGKARESMGLCPQHNMLFERLTVSEQLRLFGQLRGLSMLSAKAEANTLLTQMNMLDKSSVLSKNLSGGQKRKLCLGMALIGGTKVVVLDEPTSGMDPQARREIWDLLLQLRGERTILLTTHFMEEADVLGDRIGIMADGMLQCCGTTAFLKKYYGTGYTLKLTLHGGASTVYVPPEAQASAVSEAVGAILATVQKHVPDARLKADVRPDHVGNELLLTLPAETATTAALSQMFSDLTARQDKLGIKTMGLSQTTMDEVFVKVGALADIVKHGGAPINDDWLEGQVFEKAPKQAKNKFVVQFMSLLVKKLTYCIRKWMMLLFETFIPLVLFLTVVHSTHFFARPREVPGSSGGRSYPVERQSSLSESSLSFDEPPDFPLAISLDGYEDPVTFYSETDPATNFLTKVIPSAKITTNVTAELISAGLNDRVSYKRKHVIAAVMSSVQFTAMFNLYPYHAAPLAINTATNTLLKSLDPSADFRLQVTNHPFMETSSKHSSQYGRSFRQGEPRPYDAKYINYFPLMSVPKLVKCLIPLGLLILVTNFVVNPIEENLCKAKQLQTMTGVNPMVYWGAAFTWDYCFYLVIILLMFLYLVIFENMFGYPVLSYGWGWMVFLGILMIYGFSAIFFSYLLSIRASSVAGGFILVTFAHIMTGLILGAFLPDPTPFDKGTSKHVMGVFRFIGRLFPSYYFVRALGLYGLIAVLNSDCPLLASEPEKCPDSAPFMVWGYLMQTGSYDDDYRPVSYVVPGIGQELFFMVFMGGIYVGLLMLVEFKIVKMVLGMICRQQQQAFPPNISDEDVFLETERVNMLLSSGGVGTECLLVQNLSRSFGSFAAVSRLQFGVHYGECFGLLGVNGAGKTTAFRMITGDEIPSMGNAFGFNTSLQQDPKRFFSNIGYCPQFDGILPIFTGKEMLMLFAGLRGVPFRMRGKEAMKWLTRMGLQESAHAKCGRYSGGMKRRLSTAMAMIGDPALILLDEPTSGVDPVSRRQFWKILDKMRESGHSIILTSHSMEECEALCSRLGIMVNGQLQCFGGVQHLKNKFAQGYSLTLKLKPDLPYGSPELDMQLQNFQGKIMERFQPCELKDKHQNLLQYHLKNPSITWDSLFKAMEEIKSEFEHLIEDYSVNETSLEEVFLAFARMQYPERKAKVNLCMQILTCSC